MSRKNTTTAEAASPVTVTHTTPDSQEQLFKAMLAESEARNKALEARLDTLSQLLQNTAKDRQPKTPTVNFSPAGQLRGDTVNVPVNGEEAVRIALPHPQYKGSWQMNEAHSNKEIDRSTIDLVITMPMIRIAPDDSYYPRLKVGSFGSADLDFTPAQFQAFEAYCKAIGLDLSNSQQLQALRDKVSIIGVGRSVKAEVSKRKAVKPVASEATQALEAKQLQETLGAKVSSPAS